MADERKCYSHAWLLVDKGSFRDITSSSDQLSIAYHRSSDKLQAGGSQLATVSKSYAKHHVALALL